MSGYWLWVIGYGLLRVESIHDVGHFGVGHGGVEGEAQFLMSETFCDGEREVVVFQIAGLEVGRNRIMDEGADAPFLQVLLQLVTLGREDGEDMIDVVTVVHEFGQTDPVVLDMMIIGTRYVLSSLVLCIEVVQLHVKDSCLNVIQSTVTSLVSGHILLGETIIGDGTDGLRQRLIVGGHSTTITQSSEVLARIETVTGGLAEGTGLFKGYR